MSLHDGGDILTKYIDGSVISKEYGGCTCNSLGEVVDEMEKRVEPSTKPGGHQKEQ